MKVNITINSTEDITEFSMEIKDNQFEFLKKIEELSRKTADCYSMPTISVKESK